MEECLHLSLIVRAASYTPSTSNRVMIQYQTPGLPGAQGGAAFGWALSPRVVPLRLPGGPEILLLQVACTPKGSCRVPAGFLPGFSSRVQPIFLPGPVQNPATQMVPGGAFRHQK